jgi:hypothetical protein
VCVLSKICAGSSWRARSIRHAERCCCIERASFAECEFGRSGYAGIPFGDIGESPTRCARGESVIGVISQPPYLIPSPISFVTFGIRTFPAVAVVVRCSSNCCIDYTRSLLRCYRGDDRRRCEGNRYSLAFRATRYDICRGLG